MKVTYLGDGVVDKVGFDGHELPEGEAVDYTPSHPARLETLKNHPYFEVDFEAEEEPVANEDTAFPDLEEMDKKQLEAFAKDRYGVDLDRRKSKPNMIADLMFAIEEDADGSSDAG